MREEDKQLWSAEPDPTSKRDYISYHFGLDDVAVLRGTGQITTQAAWESLVEARYRADYEEDLDYQSGRRECLCWWV